MNIIGILTRWRVIRGARILVREAFISALLSTLALIFVAVVVGLVFGGSFIFVYHISNDMLISIICGLIILLFVLTFIMEICEQIERKRLSK